MYGFIKQNNKGMIKLMFENYNFEGEIKKIEDKRIEYIQEISSELNKIEEYAGLVVNATSLHNVEVRLIAPAIKFDIKLFDLIESPTEDNTIWIEYGSYERVIESHDEFKREVDYFFNLDVTQITIENIVKQVRDVVKKYEEEQKRLKEEEVTDETKK